MPAPAQTGGASRPARLQEFRVSITRETGEKINYTALAGNSLAVIETAISVYGVCKIDVCAKLRSVKK